MGKSSAVRNILTRIDPAFENIVICHCDPDTREYDDIRLDEDGDEKPNVTIQTDIPQIEDFDRDLKNCLIIDDRSFNDLSRSEKERLDRLFGYTSTHKNLSIMLTSQSYHAIPLQLRLCANLFVLWKCNDSRQLAEVANKVGRTKKELVPILNRLRGRDSLWVDGTSDSPYGLRINGYNIIDE
jgi:hypothetical protein